MKQEYYNNLLENKAKLFLKKDDEFIFSLNAEENFTLNKKYKKNKNLFSQNYQSFIINMDQILQFLNERYTISWLIESTKFAVIKFHIFEEALFYYQLLLGTKRKDLKFVYTLCFKDQRNMLYFFFLKHNLIISWEKELQEYTSVFSTKTTYYGTSIDISILEDISLLYFFPEFHNKVFLNDLEYINQFDFFKLQSQIPSYMLPLEEDFPKFPFKIPQTKQYKKEYFYKLLNYFSTKLKMFPSEIERCFYEKALFRWNEIGFKEEIYTIDEFNKFYNIIKKHR